MNLKELLTYLKTDIYSKMDKKDVDALFKGSLEGQLVKNINAYKNSCVRLELKKQEDKHKKEIERLRSGKDEGFTGEIYKKRSDNYVGD